MNGIIAIMRKELSDHFSSYRFVLLFALILMVSLITVYMAGMNLHQKLEGVAKPQYIFLYIFTSSGAMFSLEQFIALFGPLIGLIIGFDSINREKNEGTLSKVLSQPIYRDAVINGKFLAGVILISVMMLSIILIVTGLGLLVLGVVPDVEAVWRILIYLIISIIYISFWLGVSILFSIMFRNVATSALAAVATWIFFSFFISLGASAISESFTSNSLAEQDTLMMKAQIEKSVSLLSPMQLYADATATIINPTQRTTNPMFVGFFEQLSMERFYGPLPLSQSILVVLPYIIFLIAITVICFGVSYSVFMRQEIRSL